MTLIGYYPEIFWGIDFSFVKLIIDPQHSEMKKKLKKKDIFEVSFSLKKYSILFDYSQ
jgi:hypothetical protein